jgi:hypothetical protein
MDTGDTAPSVLLFFDQRRFIFNAGEVNFFTLHTAAIIFCQKHLMMNSVGQLCHCYFL